MQIYLDNNATTPLYREVAERMSPFLSEFAGNASSLHETGRRAREAIEAARSQVAGLIGASSEEIVFTSGGTEANNLALRGCSLMASSPVHIITSDIEHHSVLHCAAAMAHRGTVSVSYVGCDADGRISPEHVASDLEPRTRLVSVMHANNETGIVQPIRDMGSVLRGRGVLFHTDAVQTVGKLPVDVGELGVDLLSLSAHKFHGPLGVGALYVRKGTEIESLMHGGAQEGGLRPGTYNVPAIVGMGEAARLTAFGLEEDRGYIEALTEELEAGIRKIAPGCVVVGDAVQRLGNTIDVCFPDEDNHSIAVNLDTLGVAVSVGSACSSGESEPSHVLRAMGIDPVVMGGAVRFSLGSTNSEQDVALALKALKTVLGRRRVKSSAVSALKS
jgi:cysteine desulfurase